MLLFKSCLWEEDEGELVVARETLGGNWHKP